MCDKNTITLRGKKLYLATFEFICGEYGQIFHQAFYARNEEHLEKAIHKFLIDYYGKGNTSEVSKGTYFYFNGEVAVKNCGWKKVANYEQIVQQLL